MKLELLDEIIALGHGSDRSLDCIIVVKPKRFPDIKTLQEGTLRAQKLFPKTYAHEVRIVEHKSLNEFSDSSLSTPFHLELAIIENELIALKMSHLLGDAVSMLLWLKSLFSEDVPQSPIEYRTYPSKKDTPYRKILNSKVWPRPVKDRGHRRRFLRLTMEHGPLNDISLNDVMILALLDSLPFERKSIWLPVNVRKKFFEGFGNGLSRLRVYPPPRGTTLERLSHIKKQKQEARSNGEIALPSPDFNLSGPLKKNLFKAWVRRPWADWGSLSLSHIQDHEGFLSSFESIWGVSNIMPAHQAALFVVSKHQESHLTLTYDGNGVRDEEAFELLENFKNKTGETLNDLLS